LISRYEDVNTLLRDRRFGRTYLHASTHAEMGHPDPPAWHGPFWDLINAGILDMEPPNHTRVRRLVSKAFTPRFVEGLRPRVQRVMDDLVDQVDGAGEFDLMQVAEPLPVTVIAEMLGVPPSDQHRLRPWSADICKMYELNPSEDMQRDAVTASNEFSAYLRELARARKHDPGEDLISQLSLVADAGEKLTEDELVGTCVLLLNAGHEATVNSTLLGWWSLFRNPDRLKELRAERSLLANAIEELLRFDTPLQMFERWVLEPFEIHGVEIPRGAELGLLFGSANHDPAVFERPDELDLSRDPNPHLTFGAGIHFCLGAPLGRQELQVSFATLMDRFPNLESAEEPRWKPNYIIRGLEGLRVRP
jgi:cytochrome P450